MTKESSVNLRELLEKEVNVHLSGDLYKFDGLYVEDYIDHSLGTRGLKDYKEAYVAIKKAFPDITVTIEDTVVEGDKIAARYTLRGTHRGEFMGIQPTGKTFEMSEIAIVRTEGGRLAESWAIPDFISLLQQLGMEVTRASEVSTSL